MKSDTMRPEQIEAESFSIITRELGDIALPPDAAPVIKRVIHTTADFDYAKNLQFTPGVVALAQKALGQGATIVTDTTMAMAGINKTALGKLGGSVHCFIADEDVAAAAKQNGTTRSVAAMDKAAAIADHRPLILVVGNAPTALLRLLELSREGRITPAFVVGVPVGFVNVVEAKELLIESGLPSIVARGRKGGSNVAAAIINALLYEANKGQDSR